MAHSVVSAEAEARMAMDAMKMAQAEAERVKSEMMDRATDANWWAWQVKVKAADRAADRAVAAVVETSKAVARARWAA